MIKLTDAQRGMLQAAMVRDDGAASMPAQASRAGAGKVAASSRRPQANAGGQGEGGRAGLADG